MKFAFLIMGCEFDATVDQVSIHNGMSRLIGVANIDEACSVAKTLYEAGLDCIELCGAFGEAGARRIVDAVDNKIPIGYVTHLPEQEEVHRLAFAKKQ